MTCAEIDQVIHGYIDNEVDVIKAMEIEEHIAHCARCSRLQDNFLSLRSVIESGELYHRLPPGLEKRIRDTVRKERRAHAATSRRYWQVPAVAAALILCAIAVWKFGVTAPAPGTDSMLAGDIVNSHIRSLLAGHLMDVPSTDQHTVKPWFAGRIDYSPDVKDLDRQGFVLLGGRLDYIGHKTVGVLVYKRRQHLINLYSWPSDEKDKTASLIVTEQGYHVMTWHASRMSYWAVSDVSTEDIAAFARLFE